MPAPPDSWLAWAAAVEVREFVPRSPGSIEELLVLGLVAGALVGPGVAINRREPGLVGFTRVGWAEDKGELGITKHADGSCVTLRLEGDGPRRRALAQGLAVGLVVGVALAALVGWEGSAGGLALAAGAWAASLRLDRAAVVRRARAFLSSVAYLKSA